MADYSDIIEQLEKADEPDRGDDWMIHCVHGLEGVGMYGNHPAYTASLDAAIALVERLLPNVTIQIHRWPEKATAALSSLKSENEWTLGDGAASNAPFALLIALFRALQAQDRE